MSWLPLSQGDKLHGMCDCQCYARTLCTVAMCPWARALLRACCLCTTWRVTKSKRSIIFLKQRPTSFRRIVAQHQSFSIVCVIVTIRMIIFINLNHDADNCMGPVGLQVPERHTFCQSNNHLVVEWLRHNRARASGYKLPWDSSSYALACVRIEYSEQTVHANFTC